MRFLPEDWPRVREVFEGARDRTPSERRAYVATMCGDDTELLEQVERLLESDVRAGGFLETATGSSTPAAMAEGVRIGPWRILREIGHGGMGTVYLAERREGGFEQRAAIKVVRGGLADTMLLQRFNDERQILATLEHPNIARFIDGGTTADDLPYVVMEYIEGSQIDDFCDALDLRQRIELFLEVCSAVQYAHQRLIVHRDIKARNILVSPEGRPKLLDFGIAKLLDPALDREKTRTRYRVLTPDNAGPEQMRGESVTTATDVYGLGVLLYRLLTGTGPHRLDGLSDTEVVRTICEEPPEPPSRAARRRTEVSRLGIAAIPADLDHVVLKALRKEPERRYGTAAQLADDLRRHLDGLPVEAVPDSRSYRMRKFVGRHRGAVGAAVALAAVVVAGLAGTWWQARVAQRERDRAQREFNAVRSLANSVLGELHDAILPLPGSTAARELLLRRATHYLESLAPEAANDIELRREVAAGYVRLGTVQGGGGMPNVGDTAAAVASLKKAEALRESLVAALPDSPRDRGALAETYLRLHHLGAADDGSYLRRARAIIENLPASTREDAWTQSLVMEIWFQVANAQIAAKDYRGARESRIQQLRAAEALFRQRPQDLSASRNLSLAYKNLGALNEQLNATAEAIPLYEKALALDRARVDREPTHGLWRLDLSFSYGSIGFARSNMGDIPGAIEAYRQAIALRTGVVAADPNDDFARTSLAYGYERMAGLLRRSGDVSGALEASAERLAALRQRVDAHPERDNVWRDYAENVGDVVDFTLSMLDANTVSARDRASGVAKTGALLADLEDLHARWGRDKRSGELPPSSHERAAAANRLRQLASRR